MRLFITWLKIQVYHYFYSYSCYFFKLYNFFFFPRMPKYPNPFARILADFRIQGCSTPPPRTAPTPISVSIQEYKEEKKNEHGQNYIAFHTGIANY